MMEEKITSANPRLPQKNELNLEEIYAEWFDLPEFSPDYFRE